MKVYVDVWSATSGNTRWLIAHYECDPSDPEQRVVLEEQMVNAIKAGQRFEVTGVGHE